MFWRDGILEKLEDGSFRCTECGEILETAAKRDIHFHTIRKLWENPPIYLLILPTECTPGTWKAAKIFTGIIAELVKKNPHEKFQFIPFSQVGNGMDTYLVIGEFCDKSW